MIRPKRILLGAGTYYDAAEVDAYIAAEKVDVMMQCLERAIYLCEDWKCPEAAGKFREALRKMKEAG